MKKNAKKFLLLLAISSGILSLVSAAQASVWSAWATTVSVGPSDFVPIEMKATVNADFKCEDFLVEDLLVSRKEEGNALGMTELSPEKIRAKYASQLQALVDKSVLTKADVEQLGSNQYPFYYVQSFKTGLDYVVAESASGLVAFRTNVLIFAKTDNSFIEEAGTDFLLPTSTRGGWVTLQKIRIKTARDTGQQIAPSTLSYAQLIRHFGWRKFWKYKENATVWEHSRK